MKTKLSSTWRRLFFSLSRRNVKNFFLPDGQKAILVFDVFKAQKTEGVQHLIKITGIVEAVTKELEQEDPSEHLVADHRPTLRTFAPKTFPYRIFLNLPHRKVMIYFCQKGKKNEGSPCSFSRS